MPKTIYTERDIEDLARQGGKELVVSDEIYLTDLARERAEKLGITLRAGKSASQTAPTAQPVVPPENVEQVINQVKVDVIAKLGPSVDAAVIERIVRRVMSQLS